MIEPQTVNTAVFQKAEIYSARQELRRLLDVLETTHDPNFKKEAQLELESFESNPSRLHNN